MACPRCGKANAGSYIHCIHCGSRLHESASGGAISEDARSRSAELVAAACQERNRGAADRARAHCEEALALHPGNAEGHALLAEILRDEGSLAGALQEMTAAVRYESGNVAYERRLRELREEQDRAMAPLLRNLGEPRSQRPRRSAPRLRSARSFQLPAIRIPEWGQAAGLLGGLMLLLALLPRFMGNVQYGVGMLIGVLAALWVFQDSRASGKTTPVALIWAAVVFLTNLIGLLVYLLVTRSRRY